MPTSYQSPMVKDREAERSKSQKASVPNSNALVSDLLSTKGGKIFSIGPDETLGNAVKELRDKRIGALVVTDSVGALIGILSERDIVRKLAETPGQTLPQRVREVMTPEVKTCGSGDTLVSVLKGMKEGRFRHMPVVDGGTLKGMVTIGDVVNHRLDQLEREALHMKQLIVG